MAYLLTRSAFFVAERDSAIAELRSHLAEVKQLTEDSVLQKLRSGELQAQAEHRLRVLLNTGRAFGEAISGALRSAFLTRARVSELTSDLKVGEVDILYESKSAHVRQLRLEIAVLAALIAASSVALLLAYHQASGRRHCG